MNILVVHLTVLIHAYDFLALKERKSYVYLLVFQLRTVDSVCHHGEFQHVPV